MAEKELTLTSKDVQKEYLQRDRIKEKITNQYDLNKLYEQITGEEKEINIDMKRVQLYLMSIKDLPFEDIQKEGGAWIFAVQLFLKRISQHNQGDTPANMIKQNPGRIDGQFGERTKNAVRTFQKSYALEPKDGIPGPTTIAAMCQVLENNGIPMSPVQPPLPDRPAVIINPTPNTPTNPFDSSKLLAPQEAATPSKSATEKEALSLDVLKKRVDQIFSATMFSPFVSDSGCAEQMAGFLKAYEGQLDGKLYAYALAKCMDRKKVFGDTFDVVFQKAKQVNQLCDIVTEFDSWDHRDFIANVVEKFPSALATDYVVALGNSGSMGYQLVKTYVEKNPQSDLAKSLKFGS